MGLLGIDRARSIKQQAGECAVHSLKMHVSKTNDKMSTESQDFGAKVVSMLERSFNEVAIAA